MAWTYLREYGFPAGAQRFVDALQRFAAANGKPQLYHATITWAYLVTINERMESGESLVVSGESIDDAPKPTHDSPLTAQAWESFAAANPDLLIWKPSIIDALYDPETIASEHAKRVFVLPNRLPAPRSAGSRDAAADHVHE
jgi:hypothetical protein